MKKNKRILALLAVLTLVTAALAILHLSTRTDVLDGTLQIEANGQTTEIALADLTISPVVGTVVNGKGEEKLVDSQGVPLSELLTQLQITAFTSVTAVADDAYSATVTEDEIFTPDKVYLSVQENAGVCLVVFGDSNSKRQVSGVERLEVT